MRIQALILAGGKSRRMNFNKNKIFLDMCGKSIIRHMVDNLLNVKIKDIYVVANMQNYKELNNMHIFKKVCVQKIQNGTGGAVMCAIKYLDSNKKTLIINGDGPILCSDFLKEFLKLENADLTLLTNNVDKISTSGRIVRKNNKIIDIIEYKDATLKQKDITEGNAGVYLFNTKKLVDNIFFINNSNAQKELYLTDLVEIFALKNYKINSIMMPPNNNYLSVNTIPEYTMQNIKMQQDIKNKILNSGVLLIQPDTIYIETQVKVGKGTIIYGGVQILNNVNIGKNCIIYPNCVLQNCIVPSGSIIKAGSVIIS